MFVWSKEIRYDNITKSKLSKNSSKSNFDKTLSLITYLFEKNFSSMKRILEFGLQWLFSRAKVFCRT